MIQPFSKFIATVPQFIIDNDANWQELVNYVRRIPPTHLRWWAILDRVYDNTIAVTLSDMKDVKLTLTSQC